MFGYVLAYMAKEKHNVNDSINDERIKRIADRLKELRKKSGYTNYEDFAWDNDIGRMQYWRMEKGANFTMVTFLKILDAHKITLEEFFKGFDEG